MVDWPDQPSLPSGLPYGYVTPPSYGDIQSFASPFTAQQIEALREKFQEALTQFIVLAVQGFFTVGEAAFDQLSSWASTLAANADSAADLVAQLLDGLLGTGHTIADLVNYFQAIPGATIAGITAIEQNIIDAIANAMGHAGTGYTTTDILGYLGLIPGGNITGALNTAVTISGNAISSLFNASGTLASQLTGALNPGVTFLVGASNVALSTLLTNINATGGLLAPGLTGAINTGVTISGNAISTLFNSSGTLASQLTGALNTGVTISGNAVSTLFNSSGLIASQITGALNPAVTFLVGASNIALSTLLGNITATGLFSAPSITGALNTAVTISGNAVSSLFNSSGTLASALTGAINPSVTFLVGASNVALSTLLQYINSSGQFNAAQLTGALNTALTISSKTLANLVTNIDSAGLLAASGLTGALNPAVTFLVGASNIALSTLLQNLNATGQLAGSAITGAINTAATVSGTAIGTVASNAATGAAGIASLLSGAIGTIQNSFPTTFPVTFATAPTIDQVGTLINSFVPRAELQTLYDLIYNISTGPGVADVVGVSQAQVASGLTQLQQVAASGTAVAQQALADAAAAVAGVPAQITSALTTAQIDAANLIGTIPTAVTLPDITLAASTALQTLHNDITNNLRGFQFPGLNFTPTDSAGALATVTSNIDSINGVLNTAGGGTSATVHITPGVLPTTFTDLASTVAVLGTARVAKYNVTTATSDAMSVATVSANGNSNTMIILRANSDFTSFVYLSYSEIGYIFFTLGCVVAGVNTAFVSTTIPVAGVGNDVKLVSDTAYGYTIEVNNVSQYSYTDGSHVSQFGASYRNAGFCTASPLPKLVSQWSFLSAADTVGSGFRAYRISTSTAGVSGTSLAANSFFDTTERVTSDCTWTPATNNKLTVSVSGWYMATISYYGTMFSNSYFYPVLYKNGSIHQYGNITNSDPGDTGFTVGPMASSFVVYCAAGDYLQPGYVASGTVNIQGEAAGVMSYWEVAFMNSGTIS